MKEVSASLRYPPELPITEKRDEIIGALVAHQVLIVAGDTGSGKSTQLPKMCLEAGRAADERRIGHTQPRRLAARTIAERIAEELGSSIGETVGFTVRFNDRVSPTTQIKVMTDGILLAEIQRDRKLTRYDTLIIDEAHERSLNVDFLLGYVKQLLPRRPDLKLIVTSATIDTGRFSRHFDDAPVIEVSGRTYPVEMRYRPFGDEGTRSAIGAVDGGEPDERDQTQAICDAVVELAGEGPGDVLVFMSGEREIRDTADAIAKMGLRGTEVIPLFARLSSAEQHRVFQPHQGRRVVLATNVAETSLTVPGIRYVVDPGTARISRYSRRTKVQRLPIEAVSQASANQRAGRCGRVAPGICIRLYSEDDFTARPEFTEPEILRTNLASVILQMAALGLGDIAAFPFVEPPDARNISDGIALLEELGALDLDASDARTGDDRARLTPLGLRLAQLPVDPRLGRMVLEAERNGCVHEVMVIAAGLSIQDPRERPTGKEGEAAELHARFKHADSDFMGFIALWDHVSDLQHTLSSGQLRRRCKAEMLNYIRIREWHDIYSQLRDVAKSMKIPLNTEPAPVAALHRSLLSGLLSHIGHRDGDTREYQGARSARFAIAPGSSLFRSSPRWVMAAELVETNRLWGRVAARIDPGWAESVGAHLVKRSYGEPVWEAEHGAAISTERVTLYGLPIVAGRRIGYGRIDPDGARAIFIRNALVEGDWEASHEFLDRNRELLGELRRLEDRMRRNDVVVADDVLVDFFDERIPRSVLSGRHFDRWWKDERHRSPDLLTYTRDLLVHDEAQSVSTADFPEVWHQDGLALPLTYEYDPGTARDGVTVHVPVTVLNRIQATEFDWQVPGLRQELVTALIRSLPKPLRRRFVPVPEHVQAFLDHASAGDGPLLDVLGTALAKMTGDPVPPGSFDLDRLPTHLRMTFVVEADDGSVLASGPDLDALKRSLRDEVEDALTDAVAEVAAVRSTTWSFGSIARVVETTVAGQPTTAFPSLVDEGDAVSLRVLGDAAEQDDAMWAATRRLLLLGNSPPTGPIRRGLNDGGRLALAASTAGTIEELVDDCLVAALDEVMARHGAPAWDAETFEALRVRVRADLKDVAGEVGTVAGRIIACAHSVETQLASVTASSLGDAVADMRDQVDALVFPGFVAATGASRLDDVLRYLVAVERRIDKLATDPARDRDLMRRVQQVERRYHDLLGALAPDRVTPDIEAVGWMLEELRVSLFAQALGTAFPISEKRVLKELQRWGAA